MSVLSQIDLSLALTEAEYVEQSSRYRAALKELGQQVARLQRPVVILIDGWAASGRGAVIGTLAHGFGPHVCAVKAADASTADAESHHYLCRFWQRLPACGRIVIFDGSWYERVLRDRVVDSHDQIAWRRAYREINQFERQLVDFGTILLKFWLHIDPDEQLRRLQAREAAPDQAWRVTAADWQVREHWNQYADAVEEMVLKTSTLIAPWAIVGANDTGWARIDTTRAVVDALCRELDYELDLTTVGLGLTDKGKDKPAQTDLSASPEKGGKMTKDGKKGGTKKDKKGKKKDKKGKKSKKAK